MLQLQVIGNIVRDTEQRMIGGMNYNAFTIAVNVNKEQTIFVNVRKRAGEQNGIAQYLTKGKKVFVQGTMSVQAYISKTTNEATPDVTVWADSIEFLSKQETEQKPF